jgi:hypothetical protein
MSTLAWTPFVQPVTAAVHWWWVLLLPMVVGISITWKAIRLRTLDGYWRQVWFMSGQLLAGMVALAAGLMLLVRVVVPLLPAD